MKILYFTISNSIILYIIYRHEYTHVLYIEVMPEMSIFHYICMCTMTFHIWTFKFVSEYKTCHESLILFKEYIQMAMSPGHGYIILLLSYTN